MIDGRLELLVVSAVALSTLLVVGVFVASLNSATVRTASLLAAGAFLMLVAIGVSLYAWRLGAAGRSS
jgi:hypothetical protein